MVPVPPPLDAKTLAAYLQHLQAVSDGLRPLLPTLTEAEQKSLGAKTMGRESIPFAQQATQVLANYPQVLNRRITDDTIAAYPQWLATFDQASELLVVTQGLADALGLLALVAGAGVMEVAREVYDDVKKDKGRTPGLHDLELRMAERYRANGNTKDPAALKKP